MTQPTPLREQTDPGAIEARGFGQGFLRGAAAGAFVMLLALWLWL